MHGDTTPLFTVPNPWMTFGLELCKFRAAVFTHSHLLTRGVAPRPTLLTEAAPVRFIESGVMLLASSGPHDPVMNVLL
ncbi:hypothetical protein VNO77_26748 [Canavalia gladiata]|uniref:Uncharacterized protein n=1 Tax=Canavalia gladiata TaxID=3824 RepID=A0AAN9Q9X3_CANGL